MLVYRKTEQGCLYRSHGSSETKRYAPAISDANSRQDMLTASAGPRSKEARGRSHPRRAENSDGVWGERHYRVKPAFKPRLCAACEWTTKRARDIKVLT